MYVVCVVIAFHLILHCLIAFLGFSQKPPGGSGPTTRRLIRDERLFLFWVESPGGDEFLPGGATLFEFCLVSFDAVLGECNQLLRRSDCIHIYIYICNSLLF